MNTTKIRPLKTGPLKREATKATVMGRSNRAADDQAAANRAAERAAAARAAAERPGDRGIFKCMLDMSENVLQLSRKRFL